MMKPKVVKRFKLISLLSLMMLLVACLDLVDLPNPVDRPDPKPKPAAVPSGGQLAVRSTVLSPREVAFELDIFVVDKNARAISSLTDANFDIAGFTLPDGTFFDFDRSCAIASTTPGQGNYSAVLLLDQSGSMLQNDPNNLRIDAAKIFFRSLGSSDNALLAAFSSGASWGSAPAVHWGTFGRNTYETILDELAKTARGGTPLYQSVATYVSHTQQNAPNTNKAVIVFTDGEDTVGGETLAGVVKQALNAGVKIFTVGLAQADVGVLSQMALPTGGSMMFAGDARQLISMFGTLGNLLAGNMPYYRTCWRVQTDRDWFGRGAYFYTSMKVRTPEGDIFIPFYVSMD